MARPASANTGAGRGILLWVGVVVGQGSKTSSLNRLGGGGTIADKTLHSMPLSPLAAFGEIVDALAVPTAVLNLSLIHI